MKGLGIALLIIGALIAGGAFLLETSVSTSVPDMSLYSITGSISTRSEQVSNLSKMQGQLLMFGAGSVMIVIGAIFTAAGSIIEQMQRGTPEVESPIATHSPVPVPTPYVPRQLSEEEIEEEKQKERRIMLGGVLFFTALIIISVTLALTTKPSSPSLPDNILTNEEANAAMYDAAADEPPAKAKGKRHR